MSPLGQDSTARRIARIVTAANRAPSAENCQPWRFRWDGRALHVEHDAERARHEGNRDGNLSLLALGGVLEATERAAEADGMRAHVQLNLGDQSGHWASVRLEAGDVSAEARTEAQSFVAAAAQRATDRRLFRGGSLQHPVFAELATRSARFPGCGLHTIAGPSSELLRYLLDTESFVLRHAPVLDDVLRWLRFGEDELVRTADGVPWQALGLDFPQLRAAALLRSQGSWQLLRRMGLERWTRTWLRLQLSSSAALCAVTTRSLGPEQLVHAGRLAFSAWTALNRAGFGVQPMTIPALFVYNRASGALPRCTLPEFANLFSTGGKVLARAFGWSAEELPVWLMRTGLAAPLPARMRTPRLATDSILTFC